MKISSCSVWKPFGNPGHGYGPFYTGIYSTRFHLQQVENDIVEATVYYLFVEASHMLNRLSFILHMSLSTRLHNPVLRCFIFWGVRFGVLDSLMMK